MAGMVAIAAIPVSLSLCTLLSSDHHLSLDYLEHGFQFARLPVVERLLELVRLEAIAFLVLTDWSQGRVASIGEAFGCKGSANLQFCHPGFAYSMAAHQ